MKKWEVPGVGVGIIKKGKVVLAEGFGLRNVEKKLPVTPNTLFAIGSSSKAFTTMGLGILVEEGKIEWDKPVRNYLPSFKLKDEIITAKMTVRDLVTHRCGLPRHDAMWYGTTFSRKEIFDRLQFLDFSADLRSTYQYNNLMYLTAGYLIGQITTSSWEEFTRERIFKPLGMTNSNFSVEDSKHSDDYSLPYLRKEDKVEAIPFRNIDNIGPAGSINSCVNDMLKWISLHLNKGKFGDKQIISETAHKEMITPAMFLRERMLSLQPDDESDMNYGLGWFLETYRGHRLVHHGGSIDGFYALVAFLPNDDLGAVVLTNLGGTPLLHITMGYILDMMLDLDPVWIKLSQERFEKAKREREKEKEAEKEKEKERVANTTPSHALEAYAGEFEHPAYGIISITKDGNGLKGKFHTFEFNLEHWHFDVFKSSERVGLISFLTNLKGDIDRLSVSIEPAVSPIVFIRKSPEEMKDPKFLSKFVGEYEIMGTKLTIALSGNSLIANVPSQPSLELIPYKEREFMVKGVEGYTFRFIEENGKVVELLILLPQATLRGKKIK